MPDIVLTVTITGSDDALDAAFPAVPSSAATDQGMTTAEVAADFLARAHLDNYRHVGLRTRVEPARRAPVPTPLRDRAAEMADWIDLPGPIDAEDCAAWSQYVLGLTDECPL